MPPKLAAHEGQCGSFSSDQPSDRYEFRPGPPDPSYTNRANKNSRPRSSRILDPEDAKEKVLPGRSVRAWWTPAPQTKSGSSRRGQGNAKQSTGHSFHTSRPGRSWSRSRPWPTPNVCAVCSLGVAPQYSRGGKRRRDAVKIGRNGRRDGLLLSLKCILLRDVRKTMVTCCVPCEKPW